jgi:hypothetical protein
MRWLAAHFTKRRGSAIVIGTPIGSRFWAARPPSCRDLRRSDLLVERCRQQLAAFAEIMQRGLQFAQFLACQPLQGWRPDVA